MSTQIKVFRGDDEDLTITVQDSNGDAVDITGYKFYFTVKTKETDTDANAIIQKTQTSHINPTEGQTVISLTDTDTDQTPASYIYDLQYKDDNDKIKTLLKGAFIINQDITLTTA